MPITKYGTCVVEGDNYCIVIEYKYYYDDMSHDYDQPPEEDLSIQSVELNNIDITDFYWDFLDNHESYFYSKALEQARADND